MNFLVDVLRESIVVFYRSAPFLLFGFLLAGVIKVLIPAQKLAAAFGARNFRSVLLASLAGLPLPLCSCSVVPTAVALRRSGASKGATVSFLISTPESGVDSISVTYALMDPIMTIARPAAALATAFTAGAAVNLTCGADGDPADDTAGSSPAGAACTPADLSASVQRPHTGAIARLREVVRYGLGTLIAEIGPYLVGGLLLTGLISAIIPDGALANPSFSGFPAMLLMLLIGIPMYVCATSSTPIAAALILKGMSPGAALVFLLSGPATNAASLAVLWKFLGRRVVFVYLLTIAVMSLIAGMVLNEIYASSGIDAAAVAGRASEVVPGWIETLSALLLLVLLVRAALRHHWPSLWREQLRALGRPLRIDLGGPTARAIYAAILLVLYLLTSVSTIRPGEIGWVMSFGRITRTVNSPGAVLHWPYPICTFVRERIGQVRSIDLGHRQVDPLRAAHEMGGQAPNAQALKAEAEVISGDETLLAVRYSIQYGISNAYTYRFGMEDPHELITALGEYALRSVVGAETTDRVLVGHRAELESRVAEHLRVELDRLDAGITVLRVDLLDVHAPPEVHSAFRDVASALEDHERFIRQAESYRNATIASARAASVRGIAQAEGEKVRRVATAAGEAHAYTALEASCRNAREITRLRLYLDAAARVLPGARLILPLADLPLDLWIKQPGATVEWAEPLAPKVETPEAAPTPSGTDEGWREKLQRLQETQP